jgi:hypothetical protein
MRNVQAANPESYSNPVAEIWTTLLVVGISFYFRTRGSLTALRMGVSVT